MGRDNGTFTDIEGEVAWIHSVQTADFDCCEQGCDPQFTIEYSVFPYQLAQYYVDLRMGRLRGVKLSCHGRKLYVRSRNTFFAELFMLLYPVMQCLPGFRVRLPLYIFKIFAIKNS